MDIIQKLELYPHINEELKKLNDDLILTLECKSDICITSNFDGMPGSGKISNPTADHVMKVISVDDKRVAKITEEIEKLNDIHWEVSDALLSLTYAEKKVIELRYFKHFDWEVIWPQIGRERSSGFDIHNRAKEKIRKKITKLD